MNQNALVVRDMMKAKATSDQIYDRLIELGVTPCVAREWANEPNRRRVMEERAEKRRERKLLSTSRRCDTRTRGRRILFTRVEQNQGWMGQPRELQFHATKGARYYRVIT